MPALCQAVFWRLGFSHEQERQKGPGLINLLKNEIQEQAPRVLTAFPMLLVPTLDFLKTQQEMPVESLYFEEVSPALRRKMDLKM